MPRAGAEMGRANRASLGLWLACIPVRTSVRGACSGRASPPSLSPSHSSPRGENRMTSHLHKRRQLIQLLGASGVASAAGSFGLLAHAQKTITVGFIYVGPRDDYGYNQAQAEAAAQIKKQIGRA